MTIAETILLVPQIISPIEMAKPNIPELAIMAYVAQFAKVLCLKYNCNHIKMFLSVFRKIIKENSGRLKRLCNVNTFSC